MGIPWLPRAGLCRICRVARGVVLAACCDVDAGRAESFRGQFGFQRAYTDYGEMLDREQPQAVCLNAPPRLTCAEIDRLIDAAQSGGVIHMAAFNRRFMPPVG